MCLCTKIVIHIAIWALKFSQEFQFWRNLCAPWPLPLPTMRVVGTLPQARAARSPSHAVNAPAIAYLVVRRSQQRR